MLRGIIGFLMAATLGLAVTGGETAPSGKAERQPAVQPGAEAAVAEQEEEAPEKPVSAVDIQRRSEFLKRAAAYWRDAGDEEKARFFEERAAALERGEAVVTPMQPGKAKKAEGAAASPAKGEKDKAARRPRQAPMAQAIEERLAELNQQLAEAQAAGDEQRAKGLAERVGLMRTVIFQEALIREQGGRIAELERDMKAIKDLLRRLAGGGEPKGE